MKHIPNLLTGIRIAMIPFLIWRMLEGDALSSGLILITSGLTDTLDGNLARHFGWVTDLGKVLDPLADKLTQTAVCVCLLVRFPKLWFFFAPLILKDAVMTVMGVYLTRSGVKIDGAGIFGKIATVVFYVVMGLIVLFPAIPDWVTVALLSVDVACAMAAAISYIPDARRYLAEKKEKN